MSADFVPAYIDPFSGSIVIQLVIAGLIGMGTFFRKWIGRGLMMFKRPSNAENPRADKPQ